MRVAANSRAVITLDERLVVWMDGSAAEGGGSGCWLMADHYSDTGCCRDGTQRTSIEPEHNNNNTTAQARTSAHMNL